MSRIDTLPADQRAVLQLLLRQGRRYDQLSGLLGIDEAAVRRRAHDALAALGPPETPGLALERRDEIGDYLLRQDDDEHRLVTYNLLAESPGARGWARGVAAELAPLAGDGLPDIPGGDDEAAEISRADAAGTDASAADASAADASAADATAADEPALSPAPDPVAATAVPGAVTEPVAATAAAAGAGPAAGPRSSRRGGALLLAGLGLVAVAVVLVLVLRGGGDDDGGGKATSAAKSTPAAKSTATQAQPQVQAQANLVPPRNRSTLKAIGVVLVQRADGQDQLVAAVQGLPQPKAGGYGIWLYGGPGKAQWLGFFASRDTQGRLLARGALKASIGGYREVLVTREAKPNPARPGPIFLRGPIQRSNGGG